VVSCLKPVNASCTINPSCVLKRALKRAQDAFMEVLEGYTLADLVAPRARLAGLLGIPQGPSPQ
jgi:Rrf2 family nitric oxide-sensitive transcriptional repressor